MPFTVRATMDQHLEEGLIFIYQITLTQVMQVTAISATRISFPPDSRAHSSRELEILMWRTTKSLEFANDNCHKHLRSHQVKLHNDLNDLLAYNFFWKVNFYFHFDIEIHYFLLSPTKAMDKITVETILSDYVYTEILSSKVPHFIIHTVLG